MALITGEKYSEVIKISDPAAVASRVVFVTFMGNQGPYPGCLSTGYDIKFSTVAAPTVALANYRLRFSYPDGTVAKGNFFAQYMVLVPADLVGDLLVQWGHAAATDTSDYWAVHQLPSGSDCSALEVWQMTEAANFTGAVSGTVLTLSGDTTHRQYDDQPFAKRSLRISAGASPPAKTTRLGMYTNTTGYAQADAGFLDTPPSNLCVNFGFYAGSATTGDIIGKYSDANNYWRLEQITGSKLKLTFVKSGTSTVFTSEALNNYTNAAMITIQMGDAGLELLINGCPIYRNAAVTGVWGSGSGGRLTIGGRDTGAGVTNKCPDLMVMTLGIYARRLTYGELGYLSYHCRPPLRLTTMADKIQFQKVLVDGTGTGEANKVQEFDYLGVVNGVHHAIYHGGGGGTDQIFHMTGASVTTLARDGNAGVLGGGVNGEASATLAVAGHRIGDAFLLMYNTNNVSANLKYAITTDFVTFSTPATLIAKRTGDWPVGLTNTFIDDDGSQIVLLNEGVGVGAGYVTGAARGPDLLHLTLDASVNNGVQFTTSSISNSLMYSGGFGANNGNNSFLATQSGGPFVYRSANGVRNVFYHGMAGAYLTVSMTFVYMRRTVDYINYEESPTEVILGPMTEIVASADQFADFCITDLDGTINPVAWGEFFNNAGGISKIAQFTISASSIQAFVTDSINATVAASSGSPISRVPRVNRLG
jgi:hypothetical protein